MSDEDYGFSPLERMRDEHAERERDRLRRELEEWRESLATDAAWWNASPFHLIDRIDAILRGES